MAIIAISIYQKFISPLLHQLLSISSACRFEVSCSEYMKRAIKQHGALKGIWMGLVRLAHCQPFSQNLVRHCEEVRRSPVPYGTGRSNRDNQRDCFTSLPTGSQ